MDITVDEAEHSLENQLPWLAQVMEGHPFTLIPIMVGSLSDESEAAYGKILAPYCEGPSVFGCWVPLLTQCLIADPGTLFVLSSDFCHWGSRFGFVYHDKRAGPIHKCIEWLDRTGMAQIESMDPIK